jgi:phosphoglycerol transferase MdoB-like AlkP superfamily enzyme
MFEQANAVLSQQQGPFFALIQTAGNHRPYTIPQHRGTFEPVTMDAGALRENDFQSIEAFNGIRLLDHSLGRFFELARKKAYFTNTIFVLYGDHGVQAVRQNPWQELHLLDRWVPLVFYAPGLIEKGRRIDTVASLVDVLPTALGFMGVPYLNTTLGRDLLGPRPADQQFALANDGVVTNEFLLRVDARGRSRLHRYTSDAATVDVSARYPEETVALRRLHDAVRETARYMLYHNPPRPHVPVIESASPPAPVVTRLPASSG